MHAAKVALVCLPLALAACGENGDCTIAPAERGLFAVTCDDATAHLGEPIADEEPVEELYVYMSRSVIDVDGLHHIEMPTGVLSDAGREEFAQVVSEYRERAELVAAQNPRRAGSLQLAVLVDSDVPSETLLDVLLVGEENGVRHNSVMRRSEP